MTMSNTKAAKLYKLSFFLLLCLATWACGNPGDYQEALPPQSELGDVPQQNPEADDQDEVVPERKLIKTGRLRFETSSVANKRDSIKLIVKSLGGYIADESQNSFNQSLEESLIIRIPSDKFELLMSEITKGAKALEYKNINLKDVTEEYIDINSRLENKKKLEKRFQEMLPQARNVEEVLAIERELNNLRSDIESVEGRLKYLSNQISFSTLTVTFYESKKITIQFGEKISQSFAKGWENLQWVVIGLFSIWPFIILLGLFLFFRKRIKKWVRRK